MVAFQHGSIVGCKFGYRLIVFLGILGQEVSCKDDDIIAPFTQRGNDQRYDTQTIEQVFPKITGLHFLYHVSIGCGDQPEIRCEIARPANPEE
ncbi:MAG: hypothetical protein ISS63_07705 [Desulfobacteraceae bacterium]|nr:hypothetical protein [Desulfobacteraceae bacterium]